jgi:hypothetical protein
VGASMHGFNSPFPVSYFERWNATILFFLACEMPDVWDYTIGCITLPAPEGVALRLFLDEEHNPPILSPVNRLSTNRPLYVTGTIGSHKVVIGALPEGSQGMVPASNVLNGTSFTYPRNIALD